MRKITNDIYKSARRITQNSGGNGPWLFLTNPDPPDANSSRLRKTLGVRSDEDLWVELTFYPDKALMKRIIAEIWKDQTFLSLAKRLDPIVSKRLPGFQGIVAILTLQRK